MVELNTWQREITGDGGNHNEKMGFGRIACTNQLTILNMAGSTRNLSCKIIEGVCSNRNHTSTSCDAPSIFLNIIDIHLPFLFIIHKFIFIVANQVQSSLSISLSYGHLLTLSTASTEVWQPSSQPLLVFKTMSKLQNKASANCLPPNRSIATSQISIRAQISSQLITFLHLHIT